MGNIWKDVFETVFLWYNFEYKYENIKVQDRLR